ncbi:MAG: glucose-6-phosphate isomerase [Bacteroidales bacterium]|nr:glucose-6-phosphate isomerase [Bacteroidales bacterium]
MRNINPVETDIWKELQLHYNKMKNVRIKDLFSEDKDRFEKYSISFNELFVDYSKNIVDDNTFNLLFKLAKKSKLKEAINCMFSGEKINETEKRPVLHTALRNFSGKPLLVDNKDIMIDIKDVLKKMEFFSNKIRNGEWKGCTGKSITDIINIGIGGSDLGPLMVTEALKFYSGEKLRVHFVSNVDATDIIETLKKVLPETTLFIISSKSFTTIETLTNAKTAKNWFLNKVKNKSFVSKHFVAVSINKKEVKKFGIDIDNMFEFWDFVCGRFSLWSAIGLSIACYIGFKNFRELLKGAFEMDEHFKYEPFEKNIPVILALIGIWYNNFFSNETEAIFPYDQYLYKFPAYLQQGNMESNGKYVDRLNNEINYQTSPIIWGEPGTNGQHSFFQLLHQGTKFIPADFLAPIIPLNDEGDHHKILLSNFIAQTEALMNGISEDDVLQELKKRKASKKEIERILPYNVLKGNRPSNSILYKKLTPRVLGSLIAVYEHKIFVQGVIWNIFSFDQWGVEFGKNVAKKVFKALSDNYQTNDFDPSTNGLIGYYKKIREK